MKQRAKDVLHGTGGLPAIVRGLKGARLLYNQLLSPLGLAYSIGPVYDPDAEARPTITEVKREDLGHVFDRPIPASRFEGAFVVKGNWDLRCKATRLPLAVPPPKVSTPEALAHATVYELFVEGRPYEQCTSFLMMRRSIEAGRPVRKCTNLDELHAYFERLIAAHRSMSRTGYLTQKELGRSELNEINIVVGRNGELIHYSHGLHRYRLAELLDVEYLPVRVRAVHIEWARSSLNSSL